MNISRSRYHYPGILVFKKYPTLAQKAATNEKYLYAKLK